MATTTVDNYADLPEVDHYADVPSTEEMAIRTRNLADSSLPRMEDPSMQRVRPTEEDQRAADVEALWHRFRNSGLGKTLLGRNAEEDDAILRNAGVDAANKIPRRLEQGGLIPAVVTPFQGAIPRAGAAQTLPWKIAAGTVNAAAGLAEGLASPLMPLTELPVAGRALAAGFGVDMLGQVPGQAEQAYRSFKEGDVQSGVESGLGAVAGLGLGAGSALHATGITPASALLASDRVRFGPKIAALREALRQEPNIRPDMPGLVPESRTVDHYADLLEAPAPERQAEVAPPVAAQVLSRPTEPPNATVVAPEPVSAPPPDPEIDARAAARARMKAALAEPAKPVEAPQVVPEPPRAIVETPVPEPPQVASPPAEAVETTSGFTTEKGSTYQIHDDGTTTRNKAARPEHPGESGPQPRSQTTVYIDDAGATKLGEVQALGGEKKTIRMRSDGTYGVFYLKGKDAGKFEARTLTTVSKKPAVGLMPVEIWANGSVHFGNKISKIHGVVEATPAASEPVPPLLARRQAREAYKKAAGELSIARRKYKAGKIDQPTFANAQRAHVDAKAAQAAAEAVVPTRAYKSHAPDRPPSLIDKLRSGTGQLNLAEFRNADPNYEPPASLKKHFSLTGKLMPDTWAKEAVAEGLLKREITTSQDLGDEIARQWSQHVEAGKGGGKENRALDELGRQSVDFHDTVIQGKDGGEPTSIQGLNKGDKFQAPGGQKITVSEVVTSADADGAVESVTLKDGPRFGEQTVTAEGGAVHIKPGSLKAPDKVVDWLKSKKIEEHGQAFDITAVVPIWAYNGAIDVIIAAIKAGRSARDAVMDGVRWLKAKYPELDEDGAARELGAEVPGYVHPEKPAKQPTLPGVPDPRTTSIKDAVVEQEREAAGEAPLSAPERRTNEEVVSQAEAAEARDPELSAKLTKIGMNGDRPLFDWEQAVLLRERVRINSGFGKAVDEATKAAESGNQAALAAADESVQLWRARKTENDMAVGHGGAGTVAGRALAFRRTVMNEDYSLATLDAEFRATHDYRPPNREELASLKAMADEHAAAMKAADARTAEVETKARDLAVKLVDAEARAAEAAMPRYHPDIITKAEGLVRRLETAAEAAWKRIKEKMGRAGASIDPSILADLAIIGAAKIARGFTEIGRWSKAMAAHVGDWMTPEDYKLVFEASNKQFDETLHKTTPKPETAAIVGKVVKQVDAQEQIATATEKIGARLSTGEFDAIHSQVGKIHRALVTADPKITREAVVDRIHEILKGFKPDITRLETMDAISGRGKFSLPSQAEVAKIVRDQKQQIRLVGHQIDVEARRPLPRTGPQRDKMSNAARREQQILNELKRKHGVNTTNPAAQLSSALDARKTYYRNRMSDLRQEIATRQRTVKTKSPSPTDRELEAMQAEYAQVKEQHDSIFPTNRTITDAQRLSIAVTAAEKSAALWDQRLADAQHGKLWGGVKKAAGVTSPQLEAIRARRDAARDAAQELKDLATPKKTPEQIQLSALKARLSAKEARMLDQMARGDFSAKVKRPPPTPDKEVIDARFRVEQVERKWAKQKVDWELARRSTSRKIFDNTRNVVNSARDLMTSFDLSATFRQGGVISIAHPIRGGIALAHSIKALRSERAQFAVEEEIRSRPNYPLYKSSKLYLSEHSETSTRMEEAIRSNWSRKIPGVGASQRAFTTFQNRLRADSFDAMVKTLTRNGTPTPVEAAAIANFINKATGRGDLGLKEGASNAISDVFFAPRYVASRFQLLLGQPFYRGTNGTRLLIAKEYARYLIGVGAITSLGIWAGGTFETDPEKSDFGKVKFWNTRVDAMSGLVQATVLLARFAGGVGRTLGLIKPRKDVRPFSESLWKFTRSKFAPTFGTAVDLATGKNVVNEKVTPEGSVGRLILPLSLNDIIKEIEAEGLPKGLAYGLAGMLGVGVQNYDSNKHH